MNEDILSRLLVEISGKVDPELDGMIQKLGAQIIRAGHDGETGTTALVNALRALDAQMRALGRYEQANFLSGFLKGLDDLGEKKRILDSLPNYATKFGDEMQRAAKVALLPGGATATNLKELARLSLESVPAIRAVTDAVKELADAEKSAGGVSVTDEEDVVRLRSSGKEQFMSRSGAILSPTDIAAFLERERARADAARGGDAQSARAAQLAAINKQTIQKPVVKDTPVTLSAEEEAARTAGIVAEEQRRRLKTGQAVRSEQLDRGAAVISLSQVRQLMEIVDAIQSGAPGAARASEALDRAIVGLTRNENTQRVRALKNEIDALVTAQVELAETQGGGVAVPVKLIERLRQAMSESRAVGGEAPQGARLPAEIGAALRNALLSDPNYRVDQMRAPRTAQDISDQQRRVAARADVQRVVARVESGAATQDDVEQAARAQQVLASTADQAERKVSGLSRAMAVAGGVARGFAGGLIGVVVGIANFTANAVGHAIRALANFIQGTMQVAIGFVIGNLILAPFRQLEQIVNRVQGAFIGLIQRGVQLNQEMGKSADQVADEARVWDRFALALTKPAYDYVTSKFKEMLKTMAGAHGVTSDWRVLLQSFGGALGDLGLRIAKSFEPIGAAIFGGGGAFDAAKWAQGAATLAGEFAKGLVTGFTSVVIPVVTMLASWLGGYFIGHSPPPLGALHSIVEGGRQLMSEFQRGMMSADFSAIDGLAQLIKSKLDISVASYQTGKGGISAVAAMSALESARGVIQQAFAEIETGGSIAQATMSRLAGIFGEAFQDVQNYLSAFQTWRALSIQVQELQRGMEERAYQYQLYQQQAQAALLAQQVTIQRIQDIITLFEQKSAEIPERFTRGRRRELQLQLEMEQRRERAMQLENTYRERAYQMQQMQEQRELQLLQRRERAAQVEVQLAQQVLQERQRLNELEAERVRQMNGIKVTIDKEAEAKMRQWIKDNIEMPFQKAFGNSFKELEYLFKGLSGQSVTPEDLATLPKNLQDMYVNGDKARQAFQKLFSKEGLDGFVVRMDELGKSLLRVADVLGDVYKALKDVWKWFDESGAKKWVETMLAPQEKRKVTDMGAADTTFGIWGSPEQKPDPAKGVLQWLDDIRKSIRGFEKDSGSSGVGKNFEDMRDRSVAAAEDMYRELFGASVFPDLYARLSGFIGDVGALTPALDQIIQDWLSKFGLLAGMQPGGAGDMAQTVSDTQQSEGALGVAYASIAEAFTAMTASLKDQGQALWDFLWGNSIFPDLMQGDEDYVNHLGRTGNDIDRMLRRWQDAFRRVLGDIQNDLYRWLSDTFGSSLQAWFNAIYSDFEMFGRGIWDSIVKGIIEESAANPIAQYIKNSLPGGLGSGGGGVGVGDAIPGAASGGFVARTGIALIHQGEYVMPAAQVAKGETRLTVINQWAASIAEADQEKLESMVERVSYSTFKRVLAGT